MSMFLKDRKYVTEKPNLCLVVDDSDKKFLVHKLAMTCISPYFQKIFRYSHLKRVHVDFEGERLFVELLELRDISSGAVSEIIKFAYSGNVVITLENVQELMIAADKYNVVGLLKKCIVFCAKRVDPENCIGVYFMADRLQCTELTIISKMYILRNFEQLSEYEAVFNDSSFSFIQNLFQDNKLCVSNELVVWQTLIKWIKADEQTRLGFFQSLCRAIRLGVISVRDLRSEILLHPYVQQCSETKTLVNEIITTIAILESKDKLDLTVVKKETIRKHFAPRFPNDIIIVFGGRPVELEFVTSEAIIEAYDHNLERWKTVDILDPQGPRDHHQVAVYQDNVYIIGGQLGPFNIYNSCRKLNLKTKTWSEIAPMQERRAFLAAVVHTKYLYAIGGYNGSWRVKSVERYDINLNQWCAVADMNERRSGAGAAVLGNHIYVVGGFRDLCYLNSVEYYSSENNQWTVITTMMNPRSSPSVVAHENQLYAIGGLCTTGLLSCGERYDLFTQTWTMLEDDLRDKRCSASAVVMNNKIFVIGGWNGVGGLRTVEIWSTQTKKWVLGTKLIKRRTGCAACVIHNVHSVSNAAEFTYCDRERAIEEVFANRVKSNNGQNTEGEQSPPQQAAGQLQMIGLPNGVGFVANGGQRGQDDLDVDDWIDID